MLIGDLVTNNARNIPGREALVWWGERITWAQLNSRVNRLANGLISLGVQPESRVAFLLDNCKELVELCYAIAKIGCAFVPIMPRSVGREVAHIVNNVEASALFVGAQNALHELLHASDFRRHEAILQLVTRIRVDERRALLHGCHWAGSSRLHPISKPTEARGSLAVLSPIIQAV